MHETLPQANRVDEFRAVIQQGSEPLVTIPSCSNEYIAGSRITADSYKLTNAHQAKILISLDTMVDQVEAKPVVLSEEERASVEQIIEYHSKWILTTLGIDASSRKPGIHKIHFYTPDDYDRGDFPKNSSGTHTNPYGLIHIRRQKDEMYNFNHELGHRLSHHSIRIKCFSPSVSWFLFDAENSGFVPSESKLWLAFDEYLTETENYLSLFAMHKASGVDYYSGVEVGYSSALLYFDLLLTDLSNRINVPIDFLVNYFLRCHILGDTKCLELFDIAYGDGTTKLLSETDQIAHCTRLGLPVETLKERKKQYSDGKPVSMTTWGNYKIQKPSD